MIFKAIEGLITAQAIMMRNEQQIREKTTTRTLGTCFHCGIKGHLKKDSLKLNEQHSGATNQPAGNTPHPAQ